MDINRILCKYSAEVIEDLDEENFHKVLDFLIEQKCPVLEDMVENYLDLFTIDYEDFVERINYLNKKYDNKFFDLAINDLNYLSEILSD